MKTFYLPGIGHTTNSVYYDADQKKVIDGLSFGRILWGGGCNIVDASLHE